MRCALVMKRSSSFSQEGCQNSPRYTKENCQMIDYRIVCPSISILCDSLFYSLRCVANSGSYFALCVRRVKRWFVGLLPARLGETHCKKKTKIIRRREKDAGITRAEMRHKYPFISLYSRALLTIAKQNPSISFSLTPCGCLLPPASYSPYSHSILV